MLNLIGLNFGIILLILTMALVEANELNDVKFTNIVCDFSAELSITPTYCRIKLFRNRTTALTIKLYPKIELVEPFMINIQFFKKASGYKPTTFNVTVKTCDLFEGRSFNILVNLLSAWIRKFSHGIKCPFNDKNPFIVDNLVADLSQVPSYVPPVDYLLDFHLYSDSPYTHYGDIKVYLSITNKKV